MLCRQTEGTTAADSREVFQAFGNNAHKGCSAFILHQYTEDEDTLSHSAFRFSSQDIGGTPLF